MWNRQESLFDFKKKQQESLFDFKKKQQESMFDFKKKQSSCLFYFKKKQAFLPVPQIHIYQPASAGFVCIAPGFNLALFDAGTF
jgi:hypothetical protein